MYQGFVFHHSHDGSHAETIIGTQCGALGFHPSVFHISVDGVGLKVMLTLGSFLWHHIHVCLENHSFAVLFSRRGGFSHYDVLCLIFECFNTYALCEVEQKLLYFLQVSGGTWHLGERIEIAPDAFRI